MNAPNQFTIKEVTNAATLRDFVELPYRLYANHPYWVPPMRSDEYSALEPEKNPAYEFSEVKLWLVYRGKICVGRIGAIVNRLWIEKNNLQYGRFTRFEMEDDIQISKLLFDTAENWLKSKGMETVHGPLGFSNLDHQGLLIEGHDWLPSIASDYHFDYYARHLDAMGYLKEIDWLEFRITFPEALPEKTFKVAEMLKTRFGLTTVNFKHKAELEPYKRKVFELFNLAFKELFGTFALTPRMIEFYIEKFFPVLQPRYVKVVLDKEGELAGFLIALPSLSKAMRKAGGKLFPFGWYHLMQAFKHPKEMDLMLTGVRPEFQKLGVVSLLMNELWITANADGITQVETTGMLENNHVAIQMWKSFDHIQHKRKRCYIKSLISQ